jgi:circadian clock protein KaiB
VASTRGPDRPAGRKRKRAPAGKRPVESRERSAAKASDPKQFVLRLYVTGLTRASTEAIKNVQGICETHLRGRYQLEVIDIYQLPSLARDEQIVATPTLIKVLPEPLRRFIGTMSDKQKILFGLDLLERH